LKLTPVKGKWKDGIMEYWNDGKYSRYLVYATIRPAHYSIIPPFHYSVFSRGG
jgi:hypothetical protein